VFLVEALLKSKVVRSLAEERDMVIGICLEKSCMTQNLTGLGRSFDSESTQTLLLNSEFTWENLKIHKIFLFQEKIIVHVNNGNTNNTIEEA
jgi:hypothetical protein